MRPSFELTTPPAVEPVTLTEAKAHARVEHSSEDALFTRLIAAARRHVEHAAGLALITQTWKVTCSTWPAKGIPLRPHPVASLTEATIGGTVSTASFRLAKGRPALVMLATGVSAPQTDAEITATFVTGFGEAAAVPDDLKQAMLFLIAHWYENREPTAVANSLSVVGDIKFTVDALIGPHRSVRLA
jgi:uncharacterized phiE125 gp8 family phage protein